MAAIEATKANVQDMSLRAYDWVRRSVRPAPQTDGVYREHVNTISMYRSPPFFIKVPDGYSIPGATSNCQYVRHLGNQMNFNGAVVPQITTENIYRRPDKSYMRLYVHYWPDNQPSISFDVQRTYTDNGRTNVKIFYNGKASSDTRKYPIQVYWGHLQILSDHRVSARWIYTGEWGPAVGQRGNKFFIRTEDLVAAKLLQSESDNYKLINWCNQNWNNDFVADIHAPLFKMANSKRTDFIYQSGAPVYRDCDVRHDGCPNWWPSDSYRGQSSAGWGFSHRSKVCNWQGGYTWVLSQDPLGLQAQAIQTLNKVGNPNHTFYDAWPIGATTSKPTLTPVGVANWVKNNYYRANVGISMWNLPIIGGDQRASSLRTNQWLILTTLLGYKYRVAGWAAYADEAAKILCNVSVGGPNMPAYGIWQYDENISTGVLQRLVRPDYYGAQLFVWDQMPIDNTGGANPTDPMTKIGFLNFSWLRQTINELFNLPDDDQDFILSTVEATATYSQALRVYLWHKYRTLIGPSSTIPGY